MELKVKAAKGFIWSGAQVWGGQAVAFIVLLFLSRLIEPKAFGLVAYASVFITFIKIFTDQGFGDAIVQRIDINEKVLDTAFWTNALIGGLLSVGCAAGSGLIAELFNQPQLAPILTWLSPVFFLSGLVSTQEAILRRDLLFKKLAIRSLIATTAGGVIGIIMAFAGFGVWALVAQNLTNALVGLVVLWSVSHWRPRLHFSKQYFKQLFSFGSNIIGINFLNFLNRNSDDFLIGYFLGPTALGYYTIAYKLLTTMVSTFTGVTNVVAFPAFSRIQKDIDQTRSAFYKVTHFTSLVSFPAFLGLAVVAPILTVVLYGSQWTPSIPVMQILAFICIIHSVFYFNSSVVLAAGKPTWRLGITLLNAISNVIAFVLVVRFGIVAVAAAYVIRGYLLSPVEIWVVYKVIKIDVKLYLKQFIAPIISSLIMVVLLEIVKYLLNNVFASSVELVILVLLGCVTYLIAIQLFLPSLRSQLREFVSLVLPDYLRAKALK
jgi:O-antigen/teichoic acid export membrane protein